MQDTQPTRTYRGTWDEVVSHKDEIPPGSIIEVNVYAPKPDVGSFGGRSLAEVILEIGGVEGLPSDLSSNPNKYLRGFGESKTAQPSES